MSKLDNKKLYLNHINSNSVNNVPVLLQDEGRKKWVSYGLYDDMGTRLLELFNQSGFHHAIIESRVNMICGEGLEQEVSSGETYSKRTENFIEHPNMDESMDFLYKKLSYDYEIFGLSYIEVIWSNNRKSIAAINHIDASKIRWGKKNGGKLTHVFYSDNWNKLSSNKPVVIPTLNQHIKDDYPRQILPIVKYSPSVDYYTLPSYYATIKWIEIDYQISNFHEKNIINGFTPTIYFGFPNGVPTEDERIEIERKLKQKYGGTDNAGGIITAYYEPGSDNKPEIQVLSLTDADKQYEWLLNATQQQILIGHKVTNENLVGISTPGKLGSSNELLESYEIYYNQVIKHEQNDILEGLNKIMSLNGMNNVGVKRDSIIVIDEN